MTLENLANKEARPMYMKIYNAFLDVFLFIGSKTNYNAIKGS